jgi:hypothetical protein
VIQWVVQRKFFHPSQESISFVSLIGWGIIFLKGKDVLWLGEWTVGWWVDRAVTCCVHERLPSAVSLCRHSRARPWVVDGGDVLQIWTAVANVLDKQSRLADKGWSFRWWLSWGLTTPLHKKQLVTKCYKRPRFIWFRIGISCGSLWTR